MHIQIVRHEVVGSTNDEAIRHANMGAAEGLCVIANKQTEGRGREGRVWSSEEGNGLFVSIVLRPTLEPRELPILTLLCAVAVYETVKQITGVEPDIKWPNDVLVNEKKISGILLETTDTPDGTAVVVGIGLNLRSSTMPEDLRNIATSIEEHSTVEVSADHCLQTLLHQLVTIYTAFSENGIVASVLGMWSARSSYANGKLVKVSMRNQTLCGTTLGLDANGSLIVEDEKSGRMVSVTAGDVTALRLNESENEQEDHPELGEDAKQDQICDDDDTIDFDRVD